MSRRMGFIWVKPQEDGSLYATGFLETLNGDVQFKIVKNTNRLKDTHAEYVILRRDQTEKEGEEPKEYLI